MEALAYLFDQEETDTDQQEPKEKKKKRLSIGALKKLHAKTAEEARQLLIKQKQNYLAETKKRVIWEWDLNHAKALVYEAEFQQREALLRKSSAKLEEIEKAWNEYRDEQRKYKEWMKYMTCDRLPDPSSVSQMNSYIFAWTELDKDVQMSHCIKKTEEVMELLNGLEEVISEAGPHRPPKFVKDMKELRTEIRRLLQEHVDKATFYLFSRIDTDMVPINVTTSKYIAKCPYFFMSLWAELITPIPSSKGKEIRHPLKVTFDEAEITVTVPVSLLDIHKVMRAVWLYYDHWSDNCRTFDCPPLPRYYERSLYDLFLEEYDTKTEIMRQREHLEFIMKKKISGIPAEPTLSQELLAWESEPQRALSEEIIFRECEEEDNMGRQVKNFLNEFEVNLRERTFLGAFLLLEVLYQPPQPKVFRYKHSVTLRRKPPRLNQAEFYVKYPPEGKVVLIEGEESQKIKIVHSRADLVEEKKKLVIVKLKASQEVIWFEQPQLANWDPIHGYWSTEDIHDTIYDEEDGTITFKTGRLGLIGLHVSRYCSLPYSDWLLEKNEEGGVNFHLKTSKSEFFFRIKEGKVCLEWMRDVPSGAMNWIMGIYYPPAKLLELLKKGGIDVFPAPDAASYIGEIQSKHVVIERNIYQVWGLFSKSFRFKRSKFNQEAGRGNIVFQAQEVYKGSQVKYCLVQTTMCSSFVLDVSEESEVYSPAPAPYMKECIDLHSLLQSNSTGQARRRADATCYLLIQTIKEFMSYVRPLSFS